MSLPQSLSRPTRDTASRGSSIPASGIPSSVSAGSARSPSRRRRPAAPAQKHANLPVARCRNVEVRLTMVLRPEPDFATRPAYAIDLAHRSGCPRNSGPRLTPWEERDHDHTYSSPGSCHPGRGYEFAPVAASDLACMIDRISLLLENAGRFAVAFITHCPVAVLGNHVLAFLHGAKLISLWRCRTCFYRNESYVSGQGRGWRPGARTRSA